MNRIGIVNCLAMPEPDPDEVLFMRTLAEAGADARLVPWDDPTWDPADFDLCVLRSCWNYFRRPDDFLRWVDDTASRTLLLNPPHVVRDNVHKQYLERLDAEGVPVIPTAWAPKNRAFDLAATMDEPGWHDVVIKPSVSAGSYRTRRFGKDQLTDAQAFLDDLVADRDAMIQPYMTEVDRSGERCIVYIDGELTHTVRKNPRFAGGRESVSEGMPVSDQEAAFADRALATVGGGLLYARVDVIADGHGGLLLSELELVEPSLFLKQDADALDRFVATLLRIAKTKKPPR